MTHTLKSHHLNFRYENHYPQTQCHSYWPLVHWASDSVLEQHSHLTLSSDPEETYTLCVTRVLLSTLTQTMPRCQWWTAEVAWTPMPFVKSRVEVLLVSLHPYRLEEQRDEILISYHRCPRRYGNLPLLQTLNSTHRSLDRWCTSMFSPLPFPFFLPPSLPPLFINSHTNRNYWFLSPTTQFAESQLGISLIPYGRLQRYFTSIDLRSAMQDNVAFKLAFGATFALTGFAQL